MATKSYDLTNVSMFFGVIEMGGYGADAAISIEHDEDDWALAVGTDGEGTRSKMSNGSATITVTLMQSSVVNDLLSAERTLDKNTPGGTGGKPIIVKDNNGTSLFTAETGWIQKGPTAELNREATSREWTFRTDLLVALHGSN